MPRIHLTNDQKAQLVGFLNREHDFSIALKCMAERCIVPTATGTYELLRNDYEWLVRVRETVKFSKDDPDLSEQDIETLVDVARANSYSDRKAFWGSIIDSIGPLGDNGE